MSDVIILNSEKTRELLRRKIEIRHEMELLYYESIFSPETDTEEKISALQLEDNSLSNELDKRIIERKEQR